MGVASRGRSLPGSNRCGIRASARRAAALLEVVIALSVLLVCMSVIGIIFSNGTYYIERAEELARADIMTERLIGQIETGITALSAGETIGDFGEEGPPGMNFRVVVNPDKDLPDLLRVDIDVFMGNPAEDDNAKLVTTTHLLRAAPKGIDFARDFGFDEEQLAKVTEAVPGGEAVLDVNNFDPRSLASLDLDMLVQMLPTLMQALGGNLGAGDLSSLLQAAANGDTSMIQQLTQGLQNAQQGGDGKPGGPPGGPPPGDAGPGDGQPPPPPRGRGEADPDGRPDRGGPPPNIDGGRGDDGRGDGQARPPRRGGGQDPNNPDGRGGGGRRGGGGGGRRGGGQ